MFIAFGLLPEEMSKMSMISLLVLETFIVIIYYLPFDFETAVIYTIGKVTPSVNDFLISTL